MLEQLRGRNLAHVGCTIGLTLGLFIGMLVAIAIIQIVRSTTSVNWATFAWLGITAVLGGMGYVLGGRYSRRRWGDAEASDQSSR